jgi:hypothetical protein
MMLLSSLNFLTGDPGGPAMPSIPRNPGGPGGPSLPLSPRGPAGPCNDTELSSAVCLFRLLATARHSYIFHSLYQCFLRFPQHSNNINLLFLSISDNIHVQIEFLILLGVSSSGNKYLFICPSH